LIGHAALGEPREIVCDVEGCETPPVTVTSSPEGWIEIHRHQQQSMAVCPSCAPRCICPFCGGESLWIEFLFSYGFGVRCSRCSAFGPTSHNLVRAIAAWSVRVVDLRR
jgi:hypothetical protein